MSLQGPIVVIVNEVDGVLSRALEAAGASPVLGAPWAKAPGVVVSYTTDPEIQSSRKFLAEGLQTAAGVPLQCDEGADFKTFRIGLFGLDKLRDVGGTVRRLEQALATIGF